MVENNKVTMGELLDENIGRKNIKADELVTFIPMEAVSENGKIVNEIKVPFDKIKKGLTYFEKNDILVAKITPCFENGKGACLDNIKTTKGFGSTEFHVLRPNKNSISKYLFYHTQSESFRNKLEKEMVGSAGQKRVPVSSITNYVLSVRHTKEEQQCIATAIGDADDLISSLEKLINKKMLIKQGTMQELLTGKKRLDGFSGEWNEINIGNIFDISAGGDLISDCFSSYKTEKYKYDIYSNTISNNGIYGFTSNPRYEENTITVTARGTIGYAIYREKKYDAIGRLLVLKPKANINCYFISEYINNRITFTIESTGVPQLTAPQISKYTIFLPEYEEQSAIARILSDMDKEIKKLQIKLYKYKNIKRGMMEELLTGKRRLI